MASYESTIHAQDATAGRVQRLSDGIRDASVAAGAYDAAEVAVAYASRTGVELLLRHLQQGRVGPRHRSGSSTSFRIFRTTEPAALDLLMKQKNLEVRLPYGRDAVVASKTLRPPHTFHAKGYLFRSNPVGCSVSIDSGLSEPVGECAGNGVKGGNEPASVRSSLARPRRSIFRTRRRT